MGLGLGLGLGLRFRDRIRVISDFVVAGSVIGLSGCS